MTETTGGGTAPVPYCGAPPAPGGAGWNLDPALMLALLAGLALGLRRSRGGDDPRRRAALVAGWAVLALALLSPLCQLSVALFSARVGQHLLVLLVAAPLLALGWPARKGGGPAATDGGGGALALASAAFAAALWAWHLPGPYALTFASDAAYWAMHASLLAAAAWLWRGLLREGARGARPEAALFAGLATAAQMGALGALLTFAPRPLFAAHALTTAPWGLTPLEDQQLGGLLMWVPGGVGFAAASLLALASALRGDGAEGDDVAHAAPAAGPRA